MPHFDENVHCIPLDAGIDLRARLQTEHKLRTPSEPWWGDNGDDNPVVPHLRTATPIPSVDGKPRRRVIDLTQRKAQRMAAAANTPAVRTERYRAFRAITDSIRRVARAVGLVKDQNAVYTPGSGLQFDPASMEDREYALDEVYGVKSNLGLNYARTGRSPRVVITGDNHKRIVTVLGGFPSDQGFMADVRRATQACDEIAPTVLLSEDEAARGSSPRVSGGLGLVEGEGRMQAPKGKSIVLDALAFATLFSIPAIQRVAGYATCLMQHFALHVFHSFNNALDAYEDHYNHRERPVWCSPFAAATFLLGPRCLNFLDNDLTWGWAALTALGTYNPDKGGQIILWDLNLMVHFPPGTTILLPRSLIRYSFVEIAPGETRYCLIQHTPAPVFHFTENGNRTDPQFAATATEQEHAAREEQRAARKNGDLALNMLVTLEDLDDSDYVFHLPPRSPSPGSDW
ncbi:hypothetical protein C8F04DRAFT_1278435 [Mycena alexandri]|uniref:Uncharacterized protein n=1 Tax=Mycena alexandri TaxID=1745969 RepID=A0AAD6RZ43_9AGAR|nr:hypothetical protein C8F04DRAFT_1278435 [Mycena alexandri]